MSEDDTLDDAQEDQTPSHDEIVDALGAFRGRDADAPGDDESPTIGDVLTLVAAIEEYETPLVPDAVCHAVQARYQMHGDVENGGLDQFVWNQGEATALQVSAALRTVGAIENADRIDGLVASLRDFQKENTASQITSDPVRFFLQFRKTVGGPFFPIPHHDEELAETLVEYLLERPDSLPDPKRLVRKLRSIV